MKSTDHEVCGGQLLRHSLIYLATVRVVYPEQVAKPDNVDHLYPGGHGEHPLSRQIRRLFLEI